MDSRRLEKDLAGVIRIAGEYDAEKVFLFGSCLEDVASARDIDIAVQGVRPERFFEMYGRILSAADSEIDLIPLEDTRPHFSRRIRETGRLVYEKAV